MPREGKTSLTVNDETFAALKRNKPDGVTWDYYLRELLEATDKEAEDDE